MPQKTFAAFRRVAACSRPATMNWGFQHPVKASIMDSFVYDLTYFKFRELSISYDITFDKSPGVKKYLQDLRVSLVAQNFWMIYAKNYDRDPSEVSNAGGEQGQFPGTRLIGMNIKAIF